VLLIAAYICLEVPQREPACTSTTNREGQAV